MRAEQGETETQVINAVGPSVVEAAKEQLPKTDLISRFCDNFIQSLGIRFIQSFVLLVSLNLASSEEISAAAVDNKQERIEVAQPYNKQERIQVAQPYNQVKRLFLLADIVMSRTNINLSISLCTFSGRREVGRESCRRCAYGRRGTLYNCVG